VLFHFSILVRSIVSEIYRTHWPFYSQPNNRSILLMLYHSVNVISLSWSQSDHIKRCLLYIKGIDVSLGVSIWLDCVWIVSQSRLSVSTLAESRSQRSRKSWQFQKACLDDWEVWIEIEKSWFCLDTTFQSQKSQSRSRNLSRHEIYSKFWQFVLISIESELILSFFSIKISQFVQIF
jgi:hypothetical protein